MFDLLKSATVQINIRLKEPINAETLLRVLAGDVEPGPWLVHLHSFFTELPHSHVERVIREYKISETQLQNLCRSMPKSFAEESLSVVRGLAVSG